MPGEAEEMGVLREGGEEVGLALDGVFAAQPRAPPCAAAVPLVVRVVAPVRRVAAVVRVRGGRREARTDLSRVALKQQGSERVGILFGEGRRKGRGRS